MIELGMTNQLPSPLDWATYIAKTAGTIVVADHFVLPPYSQAADLIQFSVANNYIYKNATGLSAITGQTWTFSAEVYVNGATSVFISTADNLTWTEGWVEKISLAAGWNKIKVTRTFGATVSTVVNCHFSNYDPSGNTAAGGTGKGAAASGAIDMWVLWSQLEQKAYPTRIKILNSANETQCILENITAPIISEGINREFTLEFSTVIDGDKSNYVNYQHKVEAEDNYFNIVCTEEERTQEGLYIHAQCEHVSYDLISANLTSGFTATGQFSAVATLLFASTAFAVGTAQVTASVSVNITDSTNKLSVLKQLATLYGGELYFSKYTVSLLTQRGANRGVQFRYRKNLVGAKKITDNRQSVAGVPRVSYDVSVAELEFEQGYITNGANALEHYELGDTITVIDDGLSLNTPLRIVKESHDVNQRMQGQVEIGNFIDDLASTLSSMQSSIIIVDANHTSWNGTATNFDTRNDRISTTPANPVISAGGTAVDHVINTDGSSDISLEWAFTGSGDAYDIDGFVVLLRSSTSSAAYTFGTTPAEEHVMYVTKDKLAAIFEGVPADKYYTFGVKAYRMVDQDINGTGIIYSSVVQSSLAAENPYRPSSTVPFAGNIIGTINNVAVATVTSATDLLNNVVANERLGAQIVGFKAGSVRYKQDGTQVLANLPRYETGRFGSAVMSEEACTNIIAAFPTGWAVESSPAGMVATDMGVQIGAAGNTVRLTNSAATVGFYFSPLFALSPSTIYTVRIKARGTVGAPTFDVLVLSSTGTVVQLYQADVSVTGSFVTKSYTFTTTADITGANQYVRLDHAGNDAGYIEIAEISIIAKTYALTFPGYGATSVGESMVVPTAGNFTKGNATIEFTFIPTSAQVVTGRYVALWQCYIDANNSYTILIHETGRPYMNIVSGGTQYNTYDAAAPVMVVGTPYSMMFAIDGTHMRQCANGAQMGADADYVEPVGTLPTFMYLGSNSVGAAQANGLIDDTRFSSTARTAASHATAYSSGDPLAVDECTTLKQDFDSSLRQTTRNHASRPQGIFMIADNDTTFDKSRATHIIPTTWTTAQIVFNQAISELPAGGGSIVGMDGTALIDGSIILPSNVTLDLGTMIIKAKDSMPAAINMITNSQPVSGNTKITIKNGTIDGNKTASSTAILTFGINMFYVTKSELRGITVKNCLDSNIELRNCTDNVIATNNSTNSNEAGIQFVECSDNVINGNICNYNTGYGIEVITSSFGNTITGNTCTNNTFPGIYLYTGANKNTINSNICSNNGSPGILITSSESNTIGNNTCQSNSSTGLRLVAASHNNINNNIVTDNDEDGIRLYNTSDDNNIIGNTCSYNSLGSNNVYSNISLESDCDRNNIQNNICRKGTLANKAQFGIEIVSNTCEYNVVTNNDLLTSGDVAAISNGGTGTVMDLATLAVPGNRTA